MNFAFARHESFHIRTGWLRKGLNAIEMNNHIFLEPIDAMDELGIGKNMVSSLRYWLQATGLTKEDYEDGQKVQMLEPLADIIYEYDMYFEDPATFWLIHFNLAQNIKLATTWYWFFNYFNYTEFTKEEFIDRLTTYIKRSGEEPPAESSLESDFNVLRKMYLYHSTEDELGVKNRTKHIEEELMESPFVDLRLLIETENKKLKINRPNIDILPVNILYYCFLVTLDGEPYINLDDVLNKPGSIGTIFKLNINILYEYLDKFQELGYIRMDKHAGLNSITIKEQDRNKVLAEYYNNQ